MPLQIDGATVGEVRYARPDGTLATIGEARVWDGQWRTIYTSWRPRVVTLQFRGSAYVPTYISGDESLIGNLGSYSTTYFSAPVTASHRYRYSGHPTFEVGEVIPAEQTISGGGFGGSFSNPFIVTFTEARP